MTDLYIYSLLTSIICLSGWMIFNERGHIAKLFQAVFYMALAGYIISFVGGGFDSKSGVFTVVRDAICLSSIASIFMIVRKNIVIALALFGGLIFSMPTLFDFFKTGKADLLLQNLVSHTDQKEDTVDWELLVELRPGKKISDIKDISFEYQLSSEYAFTPKNTDITDLDDYIRIDIPESCTVSIDHIMNRLQKHPAVEWVELNESSYELQPIESTYKKEIDIRPLVNDPLVGQQWSYAPLEMNKYYDFISTQKIKPAKKAKLFILDSGVDGRHEDLKGHFKKFNSGSMVDDLGHGTHCAGIAASVTNNGKGRSSMIPSSEFAELYGIKVLRYFGGGTQKVIIDGIISAVDAGADVISMSLGGKSTAPREKAYNEVMEYAMKHNCIVVVAAGNSSIDAAKFCPANSKNILTIAALNQDMKRTTFSNTMENITYKLSAPGKDIISTYPGDQYKSFSGTSMATPYVSGLVTMMKSIRPDLDVHTAYRILHTTGKVVDEENRTGRCIQPYQAIKLLLQESTN